MLSLSVIFGLFYLIVLADADADVFLPHLIESIDITNCKSGKQVLDLVPGASLTFYYSETENYRKNVSMKNENCHYELQTHTKYNNKKSLRKLYGFNVYIDEMNLDGIDEINPGGYHRDCKDYVKFEVDGKFGLSTLAESQKFCGKKPKFTEFPQHDVKNRVYSESIESEMDVMIKIRKVSTFTNSRARNFNMTITVFQKVDPFKKNCRSDDQFKKCPYSSHCIRKEFFCDNRVNCILSNREAGYDESEVHSCDKRGSGSTTTMTTIVMIVTIILAIGTIVLVVNFYKCYKSNQNPISDVISERTRAQTNQTNHEINNADTTDGGSLARGLATMDQNEPINPLNEPPSYENAIKENPGLLSSFPPSYSESIEMKELQSNQ